MYDLYRFLQHMAVQSTPLTMGSDYKIALLCNAYSTCNDLLNRPMSALFESIKVFIFQITVTK